MENAVKLDKQRKAKVSPEQKEDARRLEELFLEKKAIEGFSQQGFAEAHGIAGQSTVSQYLTGRIPLNLEAAVKFAVGLDVKIEQFSPSIARELDDLITYYVGKRPSMLTEEDAQMMRRFIGLDEPERQYVRSFVNFHSGMKRI